MIIAQHLGVDFVIPQASKLFAIAGMITYGSVISLAIAKDLGQRKSMLMASIPVILFLMLTIVTGICFPGMQRGGEFAGTYASASVGRFFALSVVMFVCTRSKYVDKAERGTK